MAIGIVQVHTSAKPPRSQLNVVYAQQIRNLVTKTKSKAAASLEVL